MKNKSVRRHFIKVTSAGLGCLAFAPLIAATSDSKANPQGNRGVKKLRVVCLGAHPGDPEFGCGGTLAKFARAGHSVTLIYLTRGEAGDPTKSFAESAALRTKEAATACSLLQVKAVFAGQTDGQYYSQQGKERGNEQADSL
jgi:LmbE family N-acetylglucosaminyl deacetylase